MDHIRILRRAFDITRIYRALWVFGILLALTTTRSGGNSPGGGSSSRSNNNGSGVPFQWPNNWPKITWPNLASGEWSAIAGIVITLVCVFFVLAIVFTILRYIALTASVRMVDGYENTAAKVTVREGFRLGWNNRSFRAWLVDLLLGVIVLAFFIVSAGIVAAPLLLLLTRVKALSVIGVIMTVGLGLLFLFVFIVAAILLSLLGEFFHRAVIIENLGVVDAIRRGWQVATRRIGDTLIMGLILFGINLGLTLLLIPVVIVLLLVAGVTGGIPGLLAGGLTTLIAQGWQAITVGLLVGIPIFLILFILPLLFVRGLVETFFTTAWTLTYRELVALESGIVVPPPAPVDVPPAAQEPPAPAGL
jgi:hypothetical protein